MKKKLYKPRDMPSEHMQKEGQAIKVGDEKFDLMLNIMVGIKKSISSLVDISSLVTLTDVHFKSKNKMENQWLSNFDHLGNEEQPALKIESFKFRDYAPYVFQRIRRLSDITDEDYLESLGPDSILNLIWSNDYRSLYELCSSGQSGSLFYYTEDQRFMIKTIQPAEFHKLKAMLRPYYEHLNANPKTMVTKIYGAHMIKMKIAGINYKKYLVVMNNIFGEYEVGNRFDLKGSTVGRRAIKEERGMRYDDISGRDIKKALKDLDFIKYVGKLELVPSPQ